MSKLGNKNWWLGRTPEQQERNRPREEKLQQRQAERAEAREVRAERVRDRQVKAQAQLDRRFAFKGISVSDGVVNSRWPLAECEAIVDHGANLGKRITATRTILLGGVGGLIFKKDRNKVYLTIAGPDDVILVELKAKDETDARKFAVRFNAAAARAANPPA